LEQRLQHPVTDSHSHSHGHGHGHSHIHGHAYGHIHVHGYGYGPGYKHNYADRHPAGRYANGDRNAGAFDEPALDRAHNHA
jgi:hypothetical protein